MRAGGLIITTMVATVAAATGWLFTRIGQPSASSEPVTQPVEENPVEGVGIDSIERRIARDVPGFGGFYIDSETKRLQVWLTHPSRDSGAVRESLRRELGGHPLYDESKIDFRQGQYGFLQLQEWYEMLFQRLLGIEGVLSGDNQEAENRVVIGVVGEEAAARVTALADTLQIPEDALRVDLATMLTQTNSVQDAHRPVLGGLQIVGHSQCTIAFVAKRGGLPGVVTNSHCSDQLANADSTVYHQPYDLGSSTRIGVETVDPPFWRPGALCPTPGPPPATGGVVQGCRFSDAAWIRLDAGVTQNHGYLARPPWYSTAWNGTDFFRIALTGSPVVGQDVAKLGRSTGLEPGQVTAINKDFRSGEAPPQYMWLNQHQTNIGSALGDSGAPVFSIPLSGTDVTLYGISWGGTEVPTESAFSDIQYMQFSQELGALDIVAQGGGGGR